MVVFFRFILNKKNKFFRFLLQFLLYCFRTPIDLQISSFTFCFLPFKTRSCLNPEMFFFCSLCRCFEIFLFCCASVFFSVVSTCLVCLCSCPCKTVLLSLVLAFVSCHMFFSCFKRNKCCTYIPLITSLLGTFLP